MVSPKPPKGDIVQQPYTASCSLCWWMGVVAGGLGCSPSNSHKEKKDETPFWRGAKAGQAVEFVVNENSSIATTFYRYNRLVLSVKDHGPTGNVETHPITPGAFGKRGSGCSLAVTTRLTVSVWSLSTQPLAQF